MANIPGNPLITVIVPLYNVERYLDACISSIVNQTYKNLEIILVDDGSTDGSGAICDAWASRDDRVVVIHKKNEGIATARNTGLDHATGEYLYWVDSDDWIDDDLLETTLEVSQRTDSDMVCFEYNSANDDGTVVRVSDDAAKFPSERRCTSEQALTLLWDDYAQNFLWSFLAKRSLYKGLRFADGLVMEDMGITYRLYDAANAVYYLPKPLYNYRIRKDSILGVKSAFMPQCTVHFIPIIDEFAAKHYPQLKKTELNWAIRYLTGAIIWAYQGSTNFSKGEYQAFVTHTKRLIRQDIKALGIMNLTKTNLVKCTAIFMNAMSTLSNASIRRSERKV